jgi:hypothetical protein
MENREGSLDEIGEQKFLDPWLVVVFSPHSSPPPGTQSVCPSQLHLWDRTGCHILVMSPGSQCGVQSDSAQAQSLPSSNCGTEPSNIGHPRSLFLSQKFFPGPQKLGWSWGDKGIRYQREMVHRWGSASLSRNYLFCRPLSLDTGSMAPAGCWKSASLWAA